VYLAALSLEKTVFHNLERASELLKVALSDKTVKDSRTYMARCRLGSMGGKVDHAVVKKRLIEIQLEESNKAIQSHCSRMQFLWVEI
jgi:hypothetical protein